MYFVHMGYSTMVALVSKTLATIHMSLLVSKIANLPQIDSLMFHTYSEVFVMA